MQHTLVQVDVGVLSCQEHLEHVVCLETVLGDESQMGDAMQVAQELSHPLALFGWHRRCAVEGVVL
jgi:hypothetical protein